MVKMLKGLAVGAAVGTIIGVTMGVAVGVMVTPDLNRKTKRLIKKGKRKLADAAEDTCCNILDCII